MIALFYSVFDEHSSVHSYGWERTGEQGVEGELSKSRILEKTGRLASFCKSNSTLPRWTSRVQIPSPALWKPFKISIFLKGSREPKSMLPPMLPPATALR